MGVRATETTTASRIFRLLLVGLLLRPEHRTAVPSGKAVTVDIDDIDVAGTLSDSFGKQLFALGRHGTEYSFENFRIVDLASRDAVLDSHRSDQRLDQGIGSGRAAVVKVIPGGGFLAVTAERMDAVGNEIGRMAYRLQLTHAPDHIQPSHVAYRIEPHGAAEIEQHTVDLPRRPPLLQQDVGPPAITRPDPVADKAPGTPTPPSH